MLRAEGRSRIAGACPGGGRGLGRAMAEPRQLRSTPVLLLIGAFALFAVVGVALLLFAFDGDGDDEAAPAATEARLVFAEFGPTADRIYVAPASRLEERDSVATVRHASGWAINPATEMAGSLVAFTVLPSDAPPRRDSPAELWLLDVASGDLTRLASDADLLAAPVFDRGGRHLAYRRSTAEGAQALVRVDLGSRARTTLLTVATEFGLFPVAFAPDGALLYAELSTGGTDLYRVDEGATPELVAHASDDIARDWRLSPDGGSLSYLAPEIEAERVVHRLHVVAIADGVELAAAGVGLAIEGEQFSPVWTPAGDGITFGQEARVVRAAPAVTLPVGGGGAAPLAEPERGFDAPLGWSPDGRYLAARSFDGRDAYDPGRESLVVIAADGDRTTVSGATELIFIGWMRDA